MQALLRFGSAVACIALGFGNMGAGGGETGDATTFFAGPSLRLSSMIFSLRPVLRRVNCANAGFSDSYVPIFTATGDGDFSENCPGGFSSLLGSDIRAIKADEKLEFR